jgi:hypothetical protein
LAFAAAPQSRFALSALAMEMSDFYRPLGIVTEVPACAGLVLEVPKSDASINVDGKLDDALWRTAARIPALKENYTSGNVHASTSVLIAYTGAGIAVGFECEEPCMPQLRASNDPRNLWSGDVAEIFLDTGGVNHYIHFTVNPCGLGQAIISKGDQGLDGDWRSSWRYAVSKDDVGWRVEVFVPWKDIVSDNRPSPPEHIRANFCRERYTAEQELSSWAPTKGIFAQTGRFGLLRFMK